MASTTAPSPEVLRALGCFAGLAGSDVEPFGRGLINQTLLVRTGAACFVLQRLSPIFDPRIHGNIAAVTGRLAARGLLTPRLVPTLRGELWADLGEAGSWRLLTFVPGATFDVVASAEQARAAGELVGRFHQALVGLDHDFVGLRTGVHDTPAHLATLAAALATLHEHRLHGPVLELGQAIAAAARELPALPELPPLVGHGDLKLNNLRFAGERPPASEQPLCLLDLDTVGPVSLAYELGDAWRSWCNRGGEDQTEGAFDLELFESSWRGYQQGLGRSPSPDERRALLLGVEWVSLELAARFAADALRERYFGWDPARHPARGEHNLARARGQWSLHCAIKRARPERARLLSG